MLRGMLLLALLASCETLFPLNAPPDAAGDGVIACATDPDCPANAGLCEQGVCVQCVAPDRVDACTGQAPVCAADNACHPCGKHPECGSDACLPDGSCADESSVAYVAPQGTGDCSKAAPCGTLNAAIATGRPVVKVAAGKIADIQLTVIDGVAVTILADLGATLDRQTDGVILEVRSAGADVTIFDLEITGQTGLSDSAIALVANGGTPRLTLERVDVHDNQGFGIVSSGGALRVASSTIARNQGGGIAVSSMGTFEIVSNVVFNNGTQTGSVGGIFISTSENAANRLEFNSFALNQVQMNVGGAISCVAGNFTARNNILSDNTTAMNTLQFSGGCSHEFSIIRPGPVAPGDGNRADDPMFLALISGDLHIVAASPARGGADPDSNLGGVAARDIDGDLRVNPADIGADTVP